MNPKISGKVVAKFCAKFLHQEVLKSEAYMTGDLGTSLQKSFLRLDLKRCPLLYSTYWQCLNSAIKRQTGFNVSSLQGVELLFY